MSQQTTSMLDSVIEIRSRMSSFLPRVRIIEGMPMVGRDQVINWTSRGICLIGSGVVERIQREQPSLPLPRNLGVLSFTGIPVERFGTRPDHTELLQAALAELTWSDR